MVMFSGLVWVGMFTAFGNSTLMVLLMTGMVMRKMISSTSMTSTSGVVLICDITVTSLEPEPTFMAICVPRVVSTNRGAPAAPRTQPSDCPLLAERRRLGHRRAGTARARVRGARARDQVGVQVTGEVAQRI